MFRSLTTVVAAAGLMLAGQAALADNGKGHKYGRYNDGRNGNYYNGRDSGYDYARVIDVDPIRTRVRVRTPQRECWQETRYDDRGYDNRYDNRSVADRYTPRSSAGSMILGGIVGAAVGNQIGSGDGRRAATVAGALIGSAIGHDVAARRDARNQYDNRYGYNDYDRAPREYTVERCDTRYRDDWEERIDGYRVTYEYNGIRQTTRLPYDPGNQIRVRVDVRPDER
jgi:uncharacterized protein YcfJ